jgi:hypothetical protein
MLALCCAVYFKNTDLNLMNILTLLIFIPVLFGIDHPAAAIIMRGSFKYITLLATLYSWVSVYGCT